MTLINKNDSRIIQTNFDEDFKSKEKKELHRSLKRTIFSSKFKCSESEVIFRDDHGREIDDIVVCKNRVGRFEDKMDYRAWRTHNIIFELVTWVNPELVSELASIVIIDKSNVQERGCVMRLIEELKSGKEKGGKLSRHFNDREKPYFISYAISKYPSATQTNSINDILRYLIFDGYEISRYVRDNYESGIITVTRSGRNGNSWMTISLVVKISDIEKMSKI